MESLEKLLAQGRTREARTEAEKILATNPNDPSALLTLLKAQLVYDELPIAEATLNHLEDQGITVDTVIARAHIALQRSDATTAKALYQKALEMNDARPEAYFGMGVVLAGGDEYEASLKMFQKAVELEPRHGIYHYHLAQNYLALKRPAEAVPHVTTAIERNPFYPPAYLLLARMAATSGKLDESRRVLQEGLKHLPDDPRLLAELTNINLLGGDVGGAFKSASELLQKHPEDPAAAANLALLLIAQSRFDEALQVCEQMNSLGKSTAPLKCIEATVYQSRKPPQFEAAIEAYEQAMAIDPRDWTSANNLGLMLMRMGADRLVPRAITVLEEAVRRKPGQLEPMLNLALAYARGNEKGKSRELATQVLSYQLPKGNPVREQAERLVKALLH